jgi:hypothetical protein
MEKVIDQEQALLELIRQSMLPGQEGITIRAFLAFNRGIEIATSENITTLSEKDLVVIKDNVIFPLETI